MCLLLVSNDMNHHENFKGKSRITHHAAKPNHVLRGKFEPNHASRWQFRSHHASRKTPLPPCGNDSVISKRGYPPPPPPNPHGVYCASGIFMFVQQKMKFPPGGLKYMKVCRQTTCVSLKEAKNKNSGRRNEWCVIIRTHVIVVSETVF